MSFQNFALVPSSGENDYQSQTDTVTAKQSHSIFPFIEGLLRQEQRSKRYQGQLESRISADSAEYQRSRAYSFQLQRTVHELQHHKAQLEISLAHTADACRVIARDLGLERARVQELDSRLTEVYPSIDLLLQRLAPADNMSPQKEDGLNGHFLLENQRQQEVIASLQSMLQAREEAIKELKYKLEQVRQETSLVGLVDPENLKDEFSEDSCLEIITQSPAPAKEH
ncbi:hypothetical protein N7533_011005 [Penicillium manginii]|uniref:uncharacterized protein n=1 Tax=Penicillium manginii TaxID=203109 RepID=UPI002546F464|nr:uncharacterized protein N7533_011005 [Penicillium manginii]KAJ5741596.1 hypothetical protein N7533_011005 [Penicillium manginii]